MATRAVDTTPLSPDAAQVLLAMEAARERTLALVAGSSDEQLERVHSPIMSPLVWDLGHIAAYEDLWLAQRYAGLELLRPDLASLYDAFETPRAVRGEIEALGPADARAYMAAVSARVAEVIAERGVGDGVLCEMVLRHELQHSETMRQTMDIAGLLAPEELARMRAPLAVDDPPAGWLEIPAGAFAMGAGDDGFAYDNERPRHVVEVPGFAIARRPVSNASWMRFSEGGGYERREWWSREGWAWKEEHDITHHPAVAAGDPEAPVCHVSWFEADAFARAHDARLPTEAEWEKAATWGQEATEELAGVGRVWEWTESHFGGYPGFLAYPYREYSQVFFGERYRVLRGSSWATHPRVAGTTFRNWDLPLRRQIFAGVRLAREA
ncbi:MAG: SUMF1/EgtB/PvdO family nonheme iron enzyme [Solirubrobacteraceae bacterium]|jgi:iron(II)-dependent oxidoreductase